MTVNTLRAAATQAQSFDAPKINSLKCVAQRRFMRTVTFLIHSFHSFRDTEKTSVFNFIRQPLFNLLEDLIVAFATFVAP